VRKKTRLRFHSFFDKIIRFVDQLTSSVGLSPLFVCFFRFGVAESSSDSDDEESAFESFSFASFNSLAKIKRTFLLKESCLIFNSIELTQFYNMFVHFSYG